MLRGIWMKEENTLSQDDLLCYECLYWEEFCFCGKEEYDEDGNQIYTQGHCCRYPPRIIDGESRYPETRNTDFCGEHIKSSRTIKEVIHK